MATCSITDKMVIKPENMEKFEKILSTPSTYKYESQNTIKNMEKGLERLQNWNNKRIEK